MYYPINCRFIDVCNDAGSRIAHLGSDMQKKLKVAYTLIEQLYTGAQRIICTASHNKPPPTLIKETLKRLSMLPARFEELKRLAARAGALTALRRAKAWIPDLDSADVGNGYPSMKEDGSDFDNDDLRSLTKEMRPLASKLAEETDPSQYQSIYDADSKRVNVPTYDVQNLIPPISKHTYAPDIEPSTLISDEAVFRALTGQPLTSSHWVERRRMSRRKMIHSLQVRLVKNHDPEAGLASAHCNACDKQLSFWASKRLVIG